MATYLPELRSPSSNGDAVSAHSSFLGAPHTPADIHDIPFRPPQGDHTSLNMKRKHHSHRGLVPYSPIVKARHLQALERSGSDIHVLASRFSNPARDLQRCKSMEEVYRHSSGSISPTSVHKNTETQENELEYGARERRWTLPSKSGPTRGFTPLKSTVKQATLQKDTESPAMITLRRATNNPTPRKSEITFFPEPTFSHEKNGLLSYLISTFSRANTFNGITTNMIDSRRQSSRSTSLDSNTACGTVTMPAATVCTEVTLDASLTMPGVPPESFARRRCSTKYTSGSTVYEIIWDENDSISNGDITPQLSSAARRRSSLAAVTLEAQLARSQDASRRESQAFVEQTRQSSVRSVDMFPEQALTISKLNAVLPRLLHQTGLRDLPRSRAGRQRRSTVCSITIEEADPRTLAGENSGEHTLSHSGIDFFPPLRSRKNSVAVNVNWQGWKTSDMEMGLAETPKNRDASSPNHDSSLVSGSTKQRGSSYVTTAMGVFRQPFRRFSQSRTDEHERFADDRQPLLG